jgi:hypothetical protein
VRSASFGNIIFLRKKGIVVSVQPSRRAFLSGQRTRVDPWLSFLAKLRSRAKGKLTLDPQFFESRAHWVPNTFNDIEVARSLCQQFGVVLGLQGLEGTLDPKLSLLVVEPGREWARPIPLDMTHGSWRFDAACTMQVLQAAGVAAALGAMPNQSLAQWFAQGTHHGIAFGGLASLGIDNIEMMFFDGTIEVLGAFGAQNSEPLRSIFTQRNIPQLFDVARQSSLSLLAPLQSIEVANNRSQIWPIDCFRIDALVDHPLCEPHLGQFFVGHGGRLGWLVAVTFRSVEHKTLLEKEGVKWNDKNSAHTGLTSLIDTDLIEADKNEVQHINQAIKNIFDSSRVFLP